MIRGGDSQMDKSNVIIQTSALSKTFDGKQSVQAVKGVDLIVKKGEIFGFLGPNGAGKSTTQKMLSTLLKPTNGTALIAGYDLMTQQQEIRRHIGFVSQAVVPIHKLQGMKTLQFKLNFMA